MIPYIKGGTHAKGIWKQESDANIWVQEGWEWRVEKLNSLHLSPNIVRVIKSKRLWWEDHLARMEEGRSAFHILTGKPKGKKPLVRAMRIWEDNIRMHLK